MPPPAPAPYCQAQADLGRSSLWIDPRGTPGLASVVMPTYNRSHLLPGTLDNVRAQTYRPIEIIVVDDGSTDETQDVVRAWSTANERLPGFTVAYVRRNANGGVSAARNHGLLISKGEFIQYMDSDDRLHKHKLADQIRVLQDAPDLDYAYGATEQITDKGLRIGYVSSPMLPHRRFWNIYHLLWHTSGPLYRRRICSQVGPWNEALMVSEDWEYSARIKVLSQKADFSQNTVSSYVLHTGTHLAKDVSRAAVEARRAAIGNIASLLRSEACGDRDVWNACARALAANAVALLCLDDRTSMRANLRAAKDMSHGMVLIAVSLLYLASFVGPKTAIVWAQRWARSLRQRRASWRRHVDSPRLGRQSGTRLPGRSSRQGEGALE